MGHGGPGAKLTPRSTNIVSMCTTDVFAFTVIMKSGNPSPWVDISERGTILTSVLMRSLIILLTWWSGLFPCPTMCSWVYARRRHLPAQLLAYPQGPMSQTFSWKCVPRPHAHPPLWSKTLHHTGLSVRPWKLPSFLCHTGVGGLCIWLGSNSRLLDRRAHHCGEHHTCSCHLHGRCHWWSTSTRECGADCLTTTVASLSPRQ